MCSSSCCARMTGRCSAGSCSVSYGPIWLPAPRGFRAARSRVLVDGPRPPRGRRVRVTRARRWGLEEGPAQLRGDSRVLCDRSSARDVPVSHIHFHPDADGRLTLGAFDVSIPREHRLGNIERPLIRRLGRPATGISSFSNERSRTPYVFTRNSSSVLSARTIEKRWSSSTATTSASYRLCPSLCPRGPEFGPNQPSATQPRKQNLSASSQLTERPHSPARLVRAVLFHLSYPRVPEKLRAYVRGVNCSEGDCARQRRQCRRPDQHEAVARRPSRPLFDQGP